MSILPTTKEEKSGYLLKKGEINKSWKVRWFVLQEEKLFYYKNPEQTKPLGNIPLDQAIVRISTENTGKEFCFEIVTKQRVWQLVAKSRPDMLDWMKFLSSHTILHTENGLMGQAEEMIAKATFDQYMLSEGKEIEALLKSSHIIQRLNNAALVQHSLTDSGSRRRNSISSVSSEWTPSNDDDDD